MTQHFLSRTELLVGADGLAKLNKARLIIFGLGGVGSYAAEAIARSGTGRIGLVDFDDVCVTNINRQILALHNTVGLPKVEVMKERILQINPRANVEVYNLFYKAGNEQGLFDSAWDFVIDAIDSVSSKIDLIIKCMEKNIPVISSMGMGNKLHPELLQIADISKTHTDPLAKVIRQELRKRGIVKGLPVVFSTEKPLVPKKTEHDCRTGSACSDGPNQERGFMKRRQVPGSSSFVPAAAGLFMASYVVNRILEK